MKWLKWGALAVVILAVAALLSYSLPSSEVLRITDSESIIMEGGGGGGNGQPAAPVEDVSVVYAETLDGNPRVFRNVDTGFGFPFYFKFDSEDVAAAAQAAASQEPQANTYALVTYYGWRVPFLSMFPNVVDIERVESDYSHFPLFNIVFLTILVILFAYIAYWFRSRLRRRRARRERE